MKMCIRDSFEDENGEIENIFGDDVPYDLNAPVIEIPREDYGIWYVDVMENPDRYKGKVIEFTAKVLKPKGFPSKVFLPGRMAMTCCADDTTFLGYICKSAYAPKLQAGEWVKVRAKVQYGHVSVYKGTDVYKRQTPDCQRRFAPCQQNLKSAKI